MAKVGHGGSELHAWDWEEIDAQRPTATNMTDIFLHNKPYISAQHSKDWLATTLDFHVIISDSTNTASVVTGYNM